MTIAEALKTTQQQEVTKTVLRGFCKNPAQSTNLDTTTLYYLESHGMGHYWVSRFPNAKRSHMGVYQKERFKIEREETIIVKPNEPTDNVVSNHDQTAVFLKEVTSNEKKSLPNDANSTQNVSIETKDLKWGTIYKANLVRDNKGRDLCKPYETYYIERKPKNSPYYNDKSCNFYEDEQFKKLRGCYALTCFEDFAEIGPVAVQQEKKTVAKAEKSKKIKEVLPAAEQPVVNINLPVEAIEEPTAIIEETVCEDMLVSVGMDVPVNDIVNIEEQIKSDEVPPEPEATVITEETKDEPTLHKEIISDNANVNEVEEAKDEIKKDKQISLFDFDSSF